MRFLHDIMNYQNLVSVLSASACLSLYYLPCLRQITQTSVLIIHDIILNLIQ